MGVLDELKKEAEEAQARRSNEETERSELQRQTFDQLKPYLKKFYTYFTEFQRHLSAVERDTMASYTIRHVGEIDDLKQEDYKVTYDQTKKVMDRFQFGFRCAKAGSQDAVVRDPAAVAELTETIKKNGLKAKARDMGRGAVAFTLETVIPVMIDFRIDTERDAIALTTRNLPVLGVTRYTLSKDRITGELMDELAKMVLRRDNDFDHLMGNRMTDTGIYRIRKQLTNVTNPEVPNVPGVRAVKRKKKKKKLFGLG